MFLLVPAYPGCPGSKAVKRSLLFVLQHCTEKFQGHSGNMQFKIFKICRKNREEIFWSNEQFDETSFLAQLTIQICPH